MFDLDRIQKVRSQFLKMGCAQILDASSKYSIVLDPHIVRRTPGLLLAGPVFPVSTDNDMLPCLQGLDEAPKGSILLIKNTGAHSDALAGDIFVTAAVKQGLGGLVVDGAVRDVDAFQGLGLPVFSREINFVSAKTARVPAAKVPQEIILGTQTISPGDWIFGDGDGLIFVKSEYLSAVMTAASMLNKAESDLKAVLNSGIRLSDACGLKDFLSGKSKLKFEV